MREFFYKIHRFIYAKTGVFSDVIFSLPIVFVFLLFYWLVRRSLHKRKFGEEFKARYQKSRLNEMIKLLFFAWHTMVICVTLTPTEFWYGFWQNIISGQLLNFKIWNFSPDAPTIIPVIVDYSINGHLDWLLHSIDLFHFIINIVGFIPLGLSLPFVCKNVSFLKVTIIGLSYSSIIELWQCLIDRDSNIDDLICNVLGAVLGYLLFLLIKKLFPSFVEKGKKSIDSLLS